MPPPALPIEFADLLTPHGLGILSGRSRLSGFLREPANRFVALRGVVDPRQARRVLGVLERALPGHLSELALPIPPQTITEMTANYSEWLPKVGRVQTAYLGSRRGRAAQICEEIGLTPLLRSRSRHSFAAALAGRALRRRWGTQVLCYRAGDYAGPHNDHHPEDAEARSGYLDVHLTLCNPAVAAQELVYSRRGHLTELVSVASLGGITAYRLPFWHYTTPLRAKRGRTDEARRWVLLGTFLFAPEAGRTR